MAKKTALQELIEEFQTIKKTKCKTIQEMAFFDGVLAIIECKYIDKERDQIIEAYNDASLDGDKIGRVYYYQTFKD
jgi:hypothetical protein